jgi:hypothetical protein
MLDIRATHYISPLSEVEFESIPLTVHIVNVADETGLVTGKFRVYNDSTGLLIHTSDIAPFSLAAGAAVDASALTDFDPPAIADDLYFVIFDGNASNALVPDGISFALGAFYFDVKAQGMGPAPATHHLTHEEGGSDEIEVADMATAELDDTLVLQPDGAGGVEWEAIPAGVTDHDLLNNLAYADAGHTGFAPTTHATSHQNGGADEISVAGLSGTLADAQTPAAHTHQGDDLKFSKVHPNADATTALQILKADDATVIMNFDSTNRRVGINNATPAAALEVAGDIGILSKLYAANTGINTHNIDLNHNSSFQRFTIDSTAILNLTASTAGILTTSATAALDVNSNIIRLRTAKTPANAGAAGNAGDICWDADYIYVCVATNTWVRVETQTW